MDGVRSTIELNIYNEDLEVVAEYKTFGLRWKAYKAITAKQQELQSKSDDDFDVRELDDVIKLVFPNITDEHLEEAFVSDLFYCFEMACKAAERMGKNS